MPSSPLPDDWFPIAAATDVALRHVFHGKLLGHELAVWRADDGFVNVWTNRCLHRGVRLSIGINDGCELRCQYHGWRYANRTGGCTYMPAHPGDAPAPGMSTERFPAVERYGLVWTTLGAADGTPPTVDALERGTPMALRGVPVDAPASVVSERINADGSLDGMELFVQPVDVNHCVMRGVLVTAPPADDRLAVLRALDAQLTKLRDTIEHDARLVKAMDADPLPARAPTPTVVSGRRPALEVVVRRKWDAAEGITGFELVAADGTDLPTAQPGCHIDVHLRGGLVRQYSLVNGPGEQHLYRIGVKREPASRGGSSQLCDVVGEGDALSISAPHSRFPLRRDAVRTVLLAGGIGITPLLAMAQALHRSGPAFELHVFAQSARHLAFTEILDALDGNVHRHLGLDPAGTVSAIAEVLGAYEPDRQVYVCGPGPMLDAARRIAAELGWPEETVHFEYFENTAALDAGVPFEVHLQRSGATFTVPSGHSLLEALREHGVDVESSCEQGACGTCEVAVLEGEPDHRDVYLRPGERAEGKRMMSCVSRARSALLVLDL